MVAGVSGAVGKGFDDVAAAQKWLDDLILERLPEWIAYLRAKVDEMALEVDAARSRM